MSADAAKTAFAVIKDVLAQEGGEVQAKNKDYSRNSKRRYSRYW